jgi:hypothetical protein
MLAILTVVLVAVGQQGGQCLIISRASVHVTSLTLSQQLVPSFFFFQMWYSAMVHSCVQARVNGTDPVTSVSCTPMTGMLHVVGVPASSNVSKAAFLVPRVHSIVHSGSLAFAQVS